MKLIICIVNPADADNVIKALVSKGKHTTKLKSTGGFLSRGNITLITGVEDNCLEEVLEIIRSTCPARTELVPPPPLLTPGAGYIPTPIEVRAGGAVVFVINVDYFEKT